jgi:hypothetical protein
MKIARNYVNSDAARDQAVQYPVPALHSELTEIVRLAPGTALTRDRHRAPDLVPQRVSDVISFENSGQRASSSGRCPVS